MVVSDEGVEVAASMKSLEEQACSDIIGNEFLASRLSKLEVQGEYRNERLHEIFSRLDTTEKHISKLDVDVTQIESGMTTMKYCLGVAIALTGGIGSFLVTELIKII